MVNQVHGEVIGPEIDIFDRQRMFIDRILNPLIQKLPKLTTVVEHVTTMDALKFVESCEEEKHQFSWQLCNEVARNEGEDISSYDNIHDEELSFDYRYKIVACYFIKSDEDNLVVCK
ncbi:hypothetical protein R6Q59_017550 [Mikania micrantha]